MPELGKLLTFMVEEDRQTALGMYSRLFDDAEDEQQLMDLLVSPTRQAVVIARTYDAKERRQQLEAPEEIGGEETPAFVLAIDKLYQQVAPKRDESWKAPEEAPLEINQFSLFEDEPHPIDDSEYVPFQIEADSVPIDEEVEELPVEAPAAPPAEEQEEAVPAPEEEPAPEEAEAEEPRDLVEAVLGPDAEEEEEAEEEPAPEQKASRLPAEEPEEAPVVHLPPQELRMPERRAQTAKLSAADYDLDFIPETRRQPRVFLLILFTILAIPVTLAGIALLLIPTVLALGLAVLVIILGSATLVAAFSGFPKLADLLIVIGTSVIVLALGLLLLWVFVWFVGGAIGGLIRAVTELGRKWCYEEVPV